MINLKHITRLNSIYWAYAIKKNVQTKYPPYRLWIEPTSICNLKCAMCPNKSLEKSQLGMMDFDLFRKAIDEAKDFVHDINIHHRGEALLHKRLFDMIRYAKQRDVKLKLHTNATMLNEKNAKELLESGLDFISFSFDGLDKDTYERYRVGARYKITVKNIKDFLRLKKVLKKKKPFTVLELIDYIKHDNKYSLNELSEFKRQFDELSLDKLVVKNPHNFGGNIHLDATNGANAYSPCTYLWHSLVVLWNGDILPCTQDFNGELVLGNLKDKSLEEIFHGEELMSLRKKALTGDLSKLHPCSHCDMIKRDRILGVPVNSFRYLQK